MKCCECDVELFSFASLLQHLASHARAKAPPPPKQKRSILEELLARKPIRRDSFRNDNIDEDSSVPVLPKIELEKLFCNSDEIEIRLKTTRPVPISDDSVSSSSSMSGKVPTDRVTATTNLMKAWKFQDLVESRIKFYCMNAMVDESCQTPEDGIQSATAVECDSTEEILKGSKKEVVYENSELEIVKKSMEEIREIRAPFPQDQDFDPLSFCAVTMEDDDEQDSAIYESDLESTSGNESEEAKETAGFSHVCPESPCKAEFARSFLLTRHLKTVHNLPPIPSSRRKEFPCSLCSKVFGWCTDLKRHILTHTGERPFKCEHCSADYNRKFLLDNHLRKKHSGFASSMPLNGKRKSQFSNNSGNEKKKVRFAEDEKKVFSFECEHCDEKFDFRAQYLCHVLSH